MAFPFIPVAIGSMIVLFLAGRSSAAKPKDGGGGGGGGGDTGLRSRIVEVDELPGVFAARYSGSGGSFSTRFKELPAVNPGMRLVYKHWTPGGAFYDAEWSSGWFDTPSAELPEGGAQQMAILPWDWGQKVFLPASWKG